MGTPETAKPTPSSAIARELQLAVALHESGKLQEADRHYRAILQIEPNQPEANHNLGVLLVQLKQPDAGLAHFTAALEADPARGQYWMSYIDALILAGQPRVARQVLSLARQSGLEGKAVEELALRLDDGEHAGEQKHPPGVSQTGSSVNSNSGKDKVKAGQVRAVNKPAAHPGKNPGAQEINALAQLFSKGRLAEATVLAKTMTERYPLHGFGWKILGAVLKQIGRNAEALPFLQQAAALSPKDAQVHDLLGMALQDMGRPVEAELSYRQAVSADPRNVSAHCNLGTTLQDLGRLSEAEASFRRVLQLEPHLAEAHYNLGNTLKKMGRLIEAEACYRRALRIKPGYVNAQGNLGVILQGMGRLDEAETILRQALKTRPDFVQAYSNLGSTLHDMGRLKEALEVYEQALSIKPDFAEIHSNLGNTLHDMGRLTEAETAYRRALELKPDFLQAYSNLGTTLQDMGRLDEAMVYFRRALDINPNYIKARSNLLFMLNHSLGHSPEDCLAEARQYGQIVSNLVTSRYTHWSTERQPARLRIGFVSADFRNHPVGYFLESVLGHLALADAELIAYPTFSKSDELTARIKPLFSAWKPLCGLSDEAAARLIHEDGVHVLIDLSGHTQHSRLPLFSWKPAPVQAGWLGYFATTGVAEIDYIIGDRYVSPEKEAGHFTEKIWQLPDCYWCFSEPKFDISVSALPALSNGYITFGCFNNLTKMNDAVVAVWARILSAVPGSKLFLKYSQLNDEVICQHTLQRFASQGIGGERLILEGISPRAEYFACYHRVDIALDPFPYPGGTTTIEGLWMGVPVITKRGDRFLSHAGETIVHNAGLSDWVASDEEDYVAMAVSYASDLGRLSELRSALRGQVLASPIFDAMRFAGNFEQAMRGMWKEWLKKNEN